METKAPKLIATYYRVSTSTQEDNQTIQTQVSTLKDFAEKNQLRIVQEYKDDGWSGDTLARPALDQLRVDAKKKMWEAVLVYDPDRIARRYSYQELVMDELREAGIEIIFVTTPAPKNSEDKILHGVKGLFAEYERAKITERFRMGKIRKVKEGHILTTEALYGYNYIPKKDKVHGYYEFNEEEAKVVRMIFNWVANEKLTLRRVVSRLQEIKIKPRKSKRGVWATSTLSTMLRHRAYVGEAHWGKSYAVVAENPTKTERYRKQKKTSRRIRPEEDWYTIQIPALIDEDLFNKVQEQLANSKNFSARNVKNEYLLSGKIWCTCGRRRCGCSPMKGKHLYYRCNDRIHNFPLPKTCDEKAISVRVADKLVWEKVSGLMSDPELMLNQAERWLNNQESKVHSTVGDIKQLEKEISKLKEEEERYNKAYGAGLLTLDQLRDYILPVRERITAIESQVNKAQAERSRINTLGVPTKSEVEAYAKRASKLLKNLSFELKREIVLSTIDKVVGDQKKLQVYGYIPVTNVGSFTISRYSRPPKRR